MSLQTKQFYEFANFRLDLSEKVLLRGGVPVSLAPKVFDTLLVMIENAGRLLEKDELMQKIWRDHYVEEGNLAFNIKVIRRALGDDAARPRFIETVPRRGYRFIAEVKETIEENAPVRTLAVEPSEMAAAYKIRKVLISFLLVYLTGAVLIGFWYLRGRSVEEIAPVLSAPFASEKLSTDGKVAYAVVSPDGKNVIYTNETKGRMSVWLRQLASANNVEIIPPSDDVYAGLALSPDSGFLYFTRRPKGVEGQVDIYRVSIFGGIPARIVSQAQGWMSISPGGDKISFVRCQRQTEDNCSLWIADAVDGQNERRLFSCPPPLRIADNKISPDGRTVAFAVGQSENQSNEFGLSEVDIETGAQRELTGEKFFNIKNLAWLPDKSGLLITASKVPNKNFRIWQVSAATGSVEPLTQDSETYVTLSLDRAARTLVSTQVKSDFRLQILQLENLADRWALAGATAVSFAPDGKIVFSSRMSGNDEIWSINPDGGSRRQLTNNAADETAPLTAPDNNSIYFASNRTGAVHVWRMNADGSSQSPLTRDEGGFPVFVSPDGRWIYYHHGISRTLWRVSNAGGDEQPVYNQKKYRFAFSPDAARIAFAEQQGDERVLTIVSLADWRVSKTFQMADKRSRPTELAFSPDGTAILYITVNNEFTNNTLWRQPLSGAPPQKIASFGDDQLDHFALAPDGKSVAVVQGIWRRDAVLLKGLK